MNDRELHERASALFLELRDLPAEDRRAYFKSADNKDARLIAEVRSLLAHDTPAEEITGGADVDQRPAGTEHLPAKIGPYTVIRRIGRGGSGYVLLAEQHEPVHRMVAIKIVPHAAISPESAARFDFERRSLERAVHPNIAHVLDAGRTADGLPYLVMDYIDGVPISAYCREKSVRLVDRVALMLTVAEAVQHAHQRGVIHRDLKPGNILVCEVNGRPTPCVLDFGIAKPTPEAIAEGSPPTIGQAIGTPAYMAPEQTGGKPVDTRADVYSIGAVLYELTCGKPPIDATGDAALDPLEQLRRVRNDVAPPASRVRAADAALSRSDPVSRHMLADLDCILAKALEKSPDRRYATAAALAEDLGRLLRHEPIAARPATLAYRTARFCNRNRALVASLAVIVVASVVGVAGLAIGLIEARSQRREAINQYDAQLELNRFLTDDLLAAASPEQLGRDVTALDLLHRASRRVDRRFPDRPLIAASVHHALGVAYMELGSFEEAETHLGRAVALRRAAAGADAPETVHSEIAQASLLARLERLPEAARALNDAIRRARLIVGPDAPVLYTAVNDLGCVYISMDRGKEAVALLKEALAGRVRLLGARDPQVLATTGNLALAHERVGDTAKSLELQIEALHIADSLDEPPPMTLIGLCNNIGATYQDLNKDREAVPYLQRASEMASRWLGPDNPATLTINSNLAGLEAELGDPRQGADLYKSVAEASARTLGPDTIETFSARYGYLNSLRLAKEANESAEGYMILLADVTRVLGSKHWLSVQTQDALARSLRDAGRLDEAAPNARQAAAQFQALYGNEHQRTRGATQLLREIEAQLASGEPQPK
ncbi:MAG: serine/threonine protein kinase [Phycisphaeraceae bacterium]|nr:serine/threonine protein kinase [Phycisphaeraceae bacterium]